MDVITRLGHTGWRGRAERPLRPMVTATSPTPSRNSTSPPSCMAFSRRGSARARVGIPSFPVAGVLFMLFGGERKREKNNEKIGSVLVACALWTVDVFLPADGGNRGRVQLGSDEANGERLVVDLYLRAFLKYTLSISK